MTVFFLLEFWLCPRVKGLKKTRKERSKYKQCTVTKRDNGDSLFLPVFILAQNGCGVFCVLIITDVSVYPSLRRLGDAKNDNIRG